MNVFFEHPKITIFFVILTVCCFGIVLILPKDDSSTSISNAKGWSKENSIDCQRRSDAYFKCKWSMIEDRCICKLR